MTAASFFQAIRRFWWATLALALVGAILGAIPEPATTAETSTTTYSAHFSILLSTDDLNGVQNSSLVNQLMVFTTRGEVPKRAAVSLGQQEAEGPVLASQVEVIVDTNASSVDISTVQPSADDAVAIVNAFGDELVTFIAEHQDEVRTARLDRLLERQLELEQQITDLQGDLADDPNDALVLAKLEAASRQYSVVTEQYDTISNSISTLTLSPLERGVAIPVTTGSGGLGAPKSRTTRGALGFIIGLGAGIAVALLLSRLDRRIRSRAHAEAIFGSPASITIPFVAGSNSALEVTADKHDLLSDSYRTLRSIITFSQSSLPKPEGARRARVTLVISAGEGDGKTSVAANLAAAMAEAGKRVIAVNADFRRPTLMGRIVQPPPPPLRFTLDELVDAPVRQLLQRTDTSNLVVLDLTSVSASPGNLARATARLLPDAIAMADAVVIDSSPIGLTAEVIDLLPIVDTILMVIRLDHTQARAAEQTLELVHQLSTATFLLAVIGSTAEQSPYQAYDTSSDADTAPLGISRPVKSLPGGE